MIPCMMLGLWAETYSAKTLHHWMNEETYSTASMNQSYPAYCWLYLPYLGSQASFMNTLQTVLILGR